MPKAPKCSLCGHAHWSTEPHKFEGVNTVNKPKPVNKSCKQCEDKDKLIADLRDQLERMTASRNDCRRNAKEPDPSKRRKKRREYMRKYMAKKRQESRSSAKEVGGRGS